MVRQARSSKLREDDPALAPTTDDELETRELFQSEAAKAYVDRVQKIQKLRRGVAA